MKVYRQGDVRLVPCKVPGGVLLSEPRLRITGENGHTHLLDHPVLTLDRRMFLDLELPVQMTHEEHPTLTVPPGQYEVFQARTWPRRARGGD